MENQKPNIKIEDLNVIYNKGKSNEVRALENVNLEIFPREFVIIFGPSGCGKSTLLYAISGLQRPTSGLVEVASEKISEFDKRALAEFHRRRIGMIFQAFYLVGSLNILDNICLPKVFEDEDVKKREALATDLLRRFDIEGQSDKFPSELSGGQKQRVSIARSLINNPDVILADEPVGNLDSKSAHNVMMILKELNEIDKKTVILVTHDPAHLEYGDRIVHMRDGKVIKTEVIANRKKTLDSYIFKKEGELKDELLKQGLIREEFVSPDLRLLMKAFKELSPAQVGALIIPFKVQQLFSHVLFSMSNEQMEIAKKRLEDLLFERLTFEEFEKNLDDEMKKGGAEWDKRLAEGFARQVKAVIEQANRINFSNPEKTSIEISDYLTSKFKLNLDDEQKKRWSQIILDRLKNHIGIDELKKILDMAEIKGGMGLNKKTALKISREIEILLLLRYSA